MTILHVWPKIISKYKVIHTVIEQRKMKRRNTIPPFCIYTMSSKLDQLRIVATIDKIIIRASATTKEI